MVGSFIAAFLYICGLLLLYMVIKTAVKNGVTEAHQELMESVKSIERKLNSDE